jgi:hypothetical protein
MEISALTLKLIILLIPGILSASIYKKLTIRHKLRSDYMFTLIAIMFGMFSYLALQVLLTMATFFSGICNKGEVVYEVIDTFKNISDSSAIPYGEVMWASIISIVIAGIVIKLDTTKLLNNLARKLNLSNKYGEENLFSYFLNSSDIEWVYIRDLNNKLTYLGSVRSFSESTDFKEIVLENVTVYNYPESQELYDVKRIYLCLPKDRIIIEQAITNRPEYERQERNP